jgi:glycosyltransferase involved in cell wall biosynthesis
VRDRLGLPDVAIALFAGRLEPEKRIDRLITLWPQVRQAVPSAVLVVAGTGSLANALSAARTEGVLLCGRQDELADWFAAADMFVLPSEAEGLSNAMLEAMATGLPCVATRVGAAPDLLADGLGRLVDVDDDRGLVTAITETLQRLDSYPAERARNFVTRNYSIEATARRLADLYRGLTVVGR